MKNLPGMAYRCKNDRQCTMIFVSEGCAKLTGYEQHELVNNKTLSYNSLIQPEDRERVWSESQKALNLRTPFRQIYRIQTKDKKLKWVWEQGCGVFDEKGQLLALEGFIIDISDQIEYQNKLRKLSAAVSQAANMICITDINGIVDYVNPAFVQGTGYSFKETYRAELRNVKAVMDNDRYYNNVFQTIKQGKTWTDKARCCHKDGHWFWEQLNVGPIFDDHQKVTNVLFIGTDITLELQTQQKLVEADKMSAIGLLAAGVAHEFKNYLGGIIGYATYAQSSLDSPKAIEIVKDTLGQIVEIGERANEVAMSLLTYSKVKSSVLTKQDLRSVIEKTLELFSKELKNSCIQVETEFEYVPMVRIAIGKIQQVLLNLLLNARDAIEKHGNVKISLKREEKWVKVRVADNGVGISKDNISKIFDPFYSTKGVWGKDEVVGTGMGLSVSRNIALEHDGDLTVESEPGKGSAFILSLPISEDEDTPEQTAAGSEIAATEFWQILLLSLNKVITTKYQDEAVKIGCEMISFNSNVLFEKAVKKGANLAVADAHFAAKVELYQMLEHCQRNSIPFVMVNCGAMEYQLNELYEKALAIYSDCPDLNQILMQLRSIQAMQNT